MSRRAGNVLLVLAVTAYFASVIGWLSSDRRLRKEVFPDYSSRGTGPKGLSLAFRYLAGARSATGVRAAAPVARSVRRWTRPGDLSALEPDGVLFRIGPDPAPEFSGSPEADDDGGKRPQAAKRPPPRKKTVTEPSSPPLSIEEEAWVRGGGRLVLAIDHDGNGFTVAPTDRGAPPIEKAFPIWPRVERLGGPAPRFLSGPALERGHTLLSSGARCVAARIPFGRGELVVFAFPELFTNERLAEKDNLALLEALAGEGRPVCFDEAVHGGGAEPGLLQLLLEWGFGPALVLATLAALLALWRGRIRIGPPDEPPLERRTEALDLVDSLGRLYESTLGRGAALRLYRECLTRTVAARTGLRGEALDDRVRTMLARPLECERMPIPNHDLNAPEFARDLATINEAFRKGEHG
ncbi:MAG: hypothetical protein HY900_23225 [Deltaproteobacteria bacterium]|nr:hypothetical protein [Deltaproteobacteria bacterium]